MAVDAYEVVTWVPPYEGSPTAEMIVSNFKEHVPLLYTHDQVYLSTFGKLCFPQCDSASKDVVLLPAWQPGHWTLCVSKPTFMLLLNLKYCAVNESMSMFCRYISCITSQHSLHKYQ